VNKRQFIQLDVARIKFCDAVQFVNEPLVGAEQSLYVER
jgi:hypothetical protein